MTKHLQELEEINYIFDNFKVVYDHSKLYKGEYTTGIFVYDTYLAAKTAFKEFADALYGRGVITCSEIKVEVDGKRLLFKSRDKAINGSLKGYDKHTTLIINKGGL